MAKSSKRIIVSILTLVLTVVALGTTTFAWFSLSNVSSVSGFSGNVMAGDGLEVRMTKSDIGYDSAYKSNIVEADWTNFMDKVKNSKGEFSFKPVTAPNDAATKLLAFTQLGEKNDRLQLGLDGVEANIHYIEFDLEFRSKIHGTVNLTEYEFGGTPVRFENDGSPYLQMTDSGTKTNLEVESSAANAARMAFLNEDSEVIVNYQNGEEPYSNNGGTLITGNSVSDIFRNAGQWSYLLEGRGEAIFENDAATTPIEMADNFSGTMYEAFDSIQNATDGDAIISLDDNTTDPDYHAGKVTVKIWLEGWDADAYDVLFDALLTVDLKFGKN